MANPIVTIEMENGGIIKAELYPEIAPQSVYNFISLVKAGFYNGLCFHRVIPGFMIQGGCPQGTGMGGPGYCIKGEFIFNGVENKLKHKRGVLSMARSSSPNSAGSQFFLMHQDAPHLDGQYAGFDQCRDLHGGAEGVYDLLARLAAGVGEEQQRIVRPDSVQSVGTSRHVHEAEIRRRGADGVLFAHLCVKGICRHHLQRSQRRSQEAAQIWEIYILVAERGVDVVEVLVRQVGEPFEHVGQAVRLLQGLNLAEKGGGARSGYVYRSLSEQCRKSCELLLNGIRGHSVDGQGVAVVSSGRREKPVPVVLDHISLTRRGVRIDGRDLDDRERPCVRRVGGGCPSVRAASGKQHESRRKGWCINSRHR